MTYIAPLLPLYLLDIAGNETQSTLVFHFDIIFT